MSVSYAEETWNVIVNLQEDGSGNWTIHASSDASLNGFEYTVGHSVNDLNVIADNKSVECLITNETGKITCSENATNYILTFSTTDLTDFDSVNIFSHVFTLPENSDRTFIKTILPVGDIIATSDKTSGKEPYSPTENSTIGTDGRSVTITWPVDDKRTLFNVEIFYESSGSIAFLPILLYMFFGFLSIGLILYIYIRKSTSKSVLSVLNESERKVVNLIIQHKEIDQKELIRRLDFSKAKMSRTIKDLTDRGIIDCKRKGRKNLIKMRKKSIFSKKTDDKHEKEE